MADKPDTSPVSTTEPREEADPPDRRRPLSEQLATVAATHPEGLADELDMLGARNVAGFYRDMCTCDQCERERDAEPRSPWDWFITRY